MPVARFKKKAGAQITPYFSSDELDCHCNRCDETLIELDLVSKLTTLRKLLGKPIKITSGYRCPAYQAELRSQGFETATGVSQHELGRAVDITSKDVDPDTLAELATKAGFKAIGLSGTWIHLDLRDDAVRRWYYAAYKGKRT